MNLKNDKIFNTQYESIDKSKIELYYNELNKEITNFLNENQLKIKKNLALFKDVEENITELKVDIKNLRAFLCNNYNNNNFNTNTNTNSILNESNNNIILAAKLVIGNFSIE